MASGISGKNGRVAPRHVVEGNKEEPVHVQTLNQLTVENNAPVNPCRSNIVILNLAEVIDKESAILILGKNQIVSPE